MLGTDISATVVASLTSRTSAAARASEKRSPGSGSRNCSRLDAGAVTLEGRALVAVPEQDEAHGRRGLVGEPCGVDDVLQALLEAHVAGVQDDDLVVAPPERPARRGPVGGRGRDVRPVADRRHPVPVDAERREPVTELLVHHRDAVGLGEQPALELRRRPPGAARRRCPSR